MTDAESEVPDRPTTAVPDVVGLDAVDACALVRGAGLVPNGPAHAAEPSTGVILQQDPSAATTATVGEPVFLRTDPGNLAPD